MIKNLIQEINSFNDTNEKRLTGFPSQETFIRIFKLYYYLPIPKSYQLNYQLVQYVHPLHHFHHLLAVYIPQSCQWF